MRRLKFLTPTLILLPILIAACATTTAEAPAPAPPDEFVFGIVLVGPQNDHGWSEAHYNGGLYVEANLPDSRMIAFESLNPDAKPEATLYGVVEDMIAQGAQLIFITSDDFSADTQLVAEKYPDTYFMHISGDHVLRGEAPPNLSNYMGKMEYGKMIAGCAAALATTNNAIGYVGPLINSETLRLVNSAYLGAKYCFETYRHENPADLRFKVEWIGFWFHIPGVTTDPSQVSNTFIDQGYDVLFSGIDTTEPLMVTSERASEGVDVKVIPYDYEGACEAAPSVCLGIPYFNWGPGYLHIAQSVHNEQWTQNWDWANPHWVNINDVDNSPIGFVKGEYLTEEQSALLDQFINDLGSGSINLFQGPLNFQDGSVFLSSGESASDEQIWYMPQLLEGMEGLSE